MAHFGVVTAFETRVSCQLETRDRSRASIDPHDHAIFADADLEDLDLAYLFDVMVLDIGLHNRGEDQLVSSTPVFTLDVGTASVARFDADVRLDGLLKGGTSLELYELECSADLRLWALKREDLKTTEFYKETVAEALCSELDGRLKQAFFSYATALDAQINFALTDLMTLSVLGDSVKRMKLEDKLTILLEWSTGLRGLGAERLATALKTRFTRLTERRNSIAHSLKSTPIRQDELDEAVFLFLALAMVLEVRSLDATVLSEAFLLKDKPKKRDLLPSRPK